MKRVFGQEILNNVSKEIKEMMESQEKQIKARIEKRTLKMINSFYAESPITRLRSKATSVHASPLKSPNKKQIVNPMITILFVGMVFKSWKRYTEHFLQEEVDSNGSVIRIQQENDDSDESDEEDEDDDENLSNEKNVEIEENKQSQNDSSDSDEDEEEDEDKDEDDEKGNDNSKKGENDKQKVAFNMIGKFLDKKKKTDDNNNEEKKNSFERRKSRGSNIFRTFFASNENKIKLQKT